MRVTTVASHNHVRPHKRRAYNLGGVVGALLPRWILISLKDEAVAARCASATCLAVASVVPGRSAFSSEKLGERLGGEACGSEVLDREQLRDVGRQVGGEDRARGFLDGEGRGGGARGRRLSGRLARRGLAVRCDGEGTPAVPIATACGN